MSKLKTKKLPKVMELTFRSSHSIIVGHKPKDVCAEGLCENILTTKTPEDIVSFGLFGGSSDINKFYPDLDPKNWAPKDEDFIEPVFRGLSETIVSHWGVPISFKKKGVLKASMPLLKGITVNTNHDTEVENAVGSVPDVVWQNAYRSGGVSIPAGINLILKIDAISNPRLARGIMMEPPSIHSNSVTVRFTHEPSHPKLENFWDKVGTTDKEGKLIHVVVNRITSYKETSLVNHGADPYAQKIDEAGKIINPEYASTVYNFSEDNSQNNLNFNNTDMDFLELLAALGLSETAIPDQDALVAHFKAINENQIPKETDLTALQASSAELATLKEVDENITPGSLAALQANQVEEGQVTLKEGEAIITEAQTTALTKVETAGGVDKLIALGTAGEAHLTAIRQKAVADFKIVSGDNPSQAIIDTILAADLTAAQAFETQYSGEVENKMPLKCISCGSTEVSRGVSNQEKKDTDDNSFETSRDKFAKDSRRKASSLHETPSE